MTTVANNTDPEKGSALIGDSYESIPASPSSVHGRHAIYPMNSGSHEDVVGSDGELCTHEHFGHRAPWLRALVLGANDGLVSTAALLMGVGAGSEDISTLRLAGVSGLIAGALSMAVGEYISVASQKDAELADIEVERKEQEKGPQARARELRELALIYEERGVPPDLAHQVAVALSEKDVLRAHARDELGIDIDNLARPLQAAVVSALCFSSGAAIPLLSASFIDSSTIRLIAVVVSTTCGLACFGLAGAYLGGAAIWRGMLRVLIGGWLALAVVYAIGLVFHAS